MNEESGATNGARKVEVRKVGREKGAQEKWDEKSGARKVGR